MFVTIRIMMQVLFVKHIIQLVIKTNLFYY